MDSHQHADRRPFLKILSVIIATILTLGLCPGFGRALAYGEENDQASPASEDTITVYRLYNKWSGEHLFTADSSEKGYLTQLGWNDEGIAWKAPKTSDKPIYRLYNPYDYEHFYTTDKGEYDRLDAIGWNGEGVVYYSAPDDAMPIYRLYNPYGSGVTAHHFTKDENEKANLIPLGYKDEGIGWYGLKDESQSGNAITRGQWVSDLLKAVEINVENGIEGCPFTDLNGDANENAIKTAYANDFFNGIISNAEKSFKPSNPATREFALSTAVLALGFEDDGSELVAGDGSAANNPSLLAIALDVGLAKLDNQGNVGVNEGLTSQSERELLNKITTLIKDEPESGATNIEYKDDVVQIPEYQVSGDRFIIDTSKYPVKDGSTIALLPTEENPDGNAGEISRVVSQQGDMATVTIDQAEQPGDIVDSFEIHETGLRFEIQEDDLADGVELINGGISTADEKNGTTIKLKAPIDKGVDATIEFTPEINVDCKYEWFEFKQFDVNFTNEMKFSISGNITKEGTVALTKKPITLFDPLFGTFYVGLTPEMHYSIDGSVSVNYTRNDDITLSYKNGHLSKKHKTDNDFNGELEVSMSAGLAPYVFAEFLSIELVDFELDAGLQAKGSLTERPTGMKCIDITANPYLTLSAGKHTGWLQDLHLTFEKKLITAGNCPKALKAALHAEDWVIVPKCTWKDEPENPNDPQNPEQPDDPSKPSDPGGTTPATDFEYAVGSYYDGLKGVVTGDIRTNHSGEYDGITYSYGGEFACWHGGSFGQGFDAGYGVYITSYKGSSDHVTIPAQINGVDVVYAQIMPSNVLNESGPSYVDASQAPNLKMAFFWEPAEVKFSPNNKITYLHFQSGHNLTSCDLSSLSSLQSLGFQWSCPNSFTLNTDSLQNLDVGAMGIENLNLDGAQKLERLQAANGRLTNSTLSLKGCNNLKYIYLSDNALESFDVSAFPKLQTLDVSYNNISDTSALEAWLAQDGHDGNVLPQNV